MGSQPHRASAPRFLLDEHLGKLTRHLRMLGFDTLFMEGVRDSELVDISLREGRVLVSRDRQLIANPRLAASYRVLSAEPVTQLREVLRHFNLMPQMRPFTLCLCCNGPLEAIDKDAVRPLVPPDSWAAFEFFFRCSGCRRIYWRGSHWERMTRFVDEIRADPSLQKHCSEPRRARMKCS